MQVSSASHHINLLVSVAAPTLLPSPLRSIPIVHPLYFSESCNWQPAKGKLGFSFAHGEGSLEDAKGMDAIAASVDVLVRALGRSCISSACEGENKVVCLLIKFHSVAFASQQLGGFVFLSANLSS